MMTVSRYELPKLGYEYDALEPVYSSELLELHHSEHHKAYVAGANQAREDLAEARASGNFETLNQLQKNLAFHVAGHHLHSIFWRNISPTHDTLAPHTLSTEVIKAFGDFDAMRKQFGAAGAGLQGSGWAALSWEPVSESLIIEQIQDHQNNTSAGAFPLLVMDMWEHAYYLDYRNKKQRWIKAFWDLVNWQDVSQRLAKVRGVEVRSEQVPATKEVAYGS